MTWNKRYWLAEKKKTRENFDLHESRDLFWSTIDATVFNYKNNIVQFNFQNELAHIYFVTTPNLHHDSDDMKRQYTEIRFRSQKRTIDGLILAKMILVIFRFLWIKRLLWWSVGSWK